MRFVGFDLARCVAIVLLLTAHIGQLVGSRVGEFFGIQGLYHVSLGGVAVTLFLVISGAVLELHYGRCRVGYRDFIARRILRIYPVYWLCLVVGIALFVVGSWLGPEDFSAGSAQVDWSDVVLSISGLYAFAGEWGGPFVATSWFVGLIMVMYLIFPLVSRCIKRRPLTALAVLLVTSVASRLLLGRYEVLPTRPLDWFPLCRVFEFSLGVYLATVLPKRAYDFGRGCRGGAVVVFVGKLSFPLFLVHYPLLRVMTFLTANGVTQAVAVASFLAAALLASYVILLTDRRIPRVRLLRAFGQKGTTSAE